MDGILITARYDGNVLSCDGERPYRFTRGEHGRLLWRADGPNRNAWTPYVLWDRDREHIPRRILLRAVTGIAIIED